MNNTERELKMSLNKTEYDELLNVAKTEPQLQVNYYFAADGMPDNVMLRIRFKNDGYTFCYKKLLCSANGVNECDERETDLDETTAKALLERGINPADLKKLADVDLPLTFKCAGRLCTFRAKFVLDKWIIELDKNEYLGKTDYELECECASYELLGQLQDFLLFNYGIAFRKSAPKSARFFKALKESL